MRNKLTAAAVCAAFLALCLSGGAVMASARRALQICAETILPSLFPFFVLSSLMSRLGIPARLGQKIAPAAKRLFGVSGAGITALPVGLLGGYPMGAAHTAELLAQGQIGTEEAERLLLFCNNSGPAFLIGAVGSGVFGSARVGLLLYAAHIGAALLTGLLFRRPCFSSCSVPAVRPEAFRRAFPAAVRQAVGAVLTVCGFVVCFSVLLGLLKSWGLYTLLSLDSQTAKVLVSGFFELGTAVGDMRGLRAGPASLALAAFVFGWGGLSVHCQTAALFCEQELSLRRHLLGRCCSALFSAVTAAALASICGLR